MQISRLFNPRLFNPRLFNRSIALVAVAALILTSTVSPNRATVRACPVVILPLRVLVMQSDLVVAAHLTKSVEVGKSENAFSRQMRSTLAIKNTLLGDAGAPEVEVLHWTWEQDEGPLTKTSESDTLLMFLIRNREGSGYLPIDYSYGVKKLSDADLQVYTKRIEEISAILKSEGDQRTEIVEWLVRCAEEPATRWEGAVELASTYDLANMGYRGARFVEVQDTDPEPNVDANPTADSAEESETSDTESTETEDTAEVANAESDEVRVEGGEVEKGAPNDTFASKLTVEQKNRLEAALFSSPKIDYADYTLIDVVSKWDSQRLVPFILSRLRDVDDEWNYLVQGLMTVVSDKLKDESLSAIT